MKVIRNPNYLPMIEISTMTWKILDIIFTSVSLTKEIISAHE